VATSGPVVYLPHDIRVWLVMLECVTKNFLKELLTIVTEGGGTSHTHTHYIIIRVTVKIISNLVH
jgi:hypothetical protein